MHNAHTGFVLGVKVYIIVRVQTAYVRHWADILVIDLKYQSTRKTCFNF